MSEWDHMAVVEYLVVISVSGSTVSLFLSIILCTHLNNTPVSLKKYN